MPKTKSTPTHNHARIADMVAHAESSAANLDKYQDDEDLNLELKTRLRTAQHTIRLLSKQLVIIVDDDESLSWPWDDIVPNYIERHSD